MRLQEYTENHTSDALAGKLATVLAESQPPLQVSALILRQWFTKYHPDSGALACATVKGLESALGDVLRSVYQGMGYQELPNVVAEVWPASCLIVLSGAAFGQAESTRCGRPALSQAPYDWEECFLQYAPPRARRPSGGGAGLR